MAIKSFSTASGTTNNILEHLSNRLRDDENVVEAAVRQNQSSLVYASDRIRDDKRLALKLLPICSYPHMCVKYLSKKVQQDKEILELVKR